MDPQCQNVSVPEGIATPKNTDIQIDNLVFRSYKTKIEKINRSNCAAIIWSAKTRS